MFDPLMQSSEYIIFCRICGLLGVVAYIGGFAAHQFHWIGAHDLSYSLSKIIGATLVLISLSVDFNLSAAIIQLCFLLIGGVGVFLRLRTRRRGWTYQGDIPIPRAANQPVQPMVPADCFAPRPVLEQRKSKRRGRRCGANWRQATGR